jgi:hypothetical protein
MMLRTRLDLFSAALLSALGATQLGCGGRAATQLGGGAGSGSSGAAGTSHPAQGGSEQGGSSTGGSAPGGAGVAGSNGPPQTNHYPCKNPRDQGNGLVECESFRHRQAALKCASHVPRPEPFPNPEMRGPCKFDADCTEKPYGYCGSGGQIGGSWCYYGCVSDSECGPKQLCECAEPVGRCVAADCVTDADCPSGFMCKFHDASGGCGDYAFTCQSAADTCGGDSDCASASAQTPYCLYSPEKRGFQCAGLGCIIGRPFLVEGRERLATSAPRADWSERSELPCVSDLDESLRADLAARWTQIALMEHASIAAFARFTLQLLSLGAPASLIEFSTRAMRDETKHAKACFAVASVYAAAPRGPARLAVERSLDESSLEEIVLNTVREGCVGETVAAVEAREAAEYATDPALRALLLEISEDETRHAELAYRFVQWALPLGGPALERAVRREFAALAEQIPFDQIAPPSSELLRHGLLPEALRREIRGQAIAQIVLPCSETLFVGDEAQRADISAARAESGRYAI